MSQPSRQVEVQLGHLCNNRCVFCVSGQLSAQKRAPQLAEEPIRRQLRAAREAGAAKITLLGGEPTLQRSFLPLLQFAVDLDFDEIVIFTNGTMTPRESFRERVARILAQLGPKARERVVWRFSLQGGDEAHHDATTMNTGAWQRIQTSMEALHADGARITGNMCVVEQNYRSVATLADVAQRFDFEDLHLDMVRPRDSGDRTDAELRAMMARYTDMAPYFRQLVAKCQRELGQDFDINIGNLPYCAAPDIADVIHHDGEETVTVAASGQGTTQEGFDKYADKRTDKHKLPSCADCVFDGSCGGIFDKYAAFHGHAEFKPVGAEQLRSLDTRGAHFVRLAEAAIRRWAADRPEAQAVRVGRVDERAGAIDLAFRVPGGGQWQLIVRDARNTRRRGGWALLAPEQPLRQERGQGGAMEAVQTAEAAAHQQAAWGLSAELVGLRPAAGLASLRASLDSLAAALGATPPHVDAAAVDRAWAATRLRLKRSAERRRSGQQRVVALAERLRGQPLGGLRFDTISRGTDEGALALRWRRDDAWISVQISPDERRASPRLAHEAEGLSQAELSAFNAALGAALRGRSTTA